MGFIEHEDAEFGVGEGKDGEQEMDNEGGCGIGDEECREETGLLSVTRLEAAFDGSEPLH